MKISCLSVVFIFLLFGSGCISDMDPSVKLTRVSIDRHYIRDEYGRYVYLNGINVGCSTKLPVNPAPSEDPRKTPITFVGRPFPIEEADKWFMKIRSLGFNSIRLLAMWEAIEHEGRGKYDTEYLDYFEKIVAAAAKYDIYVVINFHENLFSRFFYSNFNRKPELGEPGDIEYMLSTLFPSFPDLKFDGRISGDGAPRWAVEACVPEKKIDSPHWGMMKLLGPLGDEFERNMIIDYIGKLLGDTGLAGGSGGGDSGGESLEDFLTKMIIMMGASNPALIPFDVTETADVYPFTNWWTNVELSYDIERCYAAFYAGDRVFPGYKFKVGDSELNIKDYLQEAYVNAWVEVVKRVKKYPNVIGYDLVNEPPGAFVVLAAAALYASADFNPDVVEEFFRNSFGENGVAIYRTLFLLNVLPLFPSRDYLNEKYVFDHKDEVDKLTEGMTEAEKEQFIKDVYIPDHDADIDVFVETYRDEFIQKYRFKDMDLFGVIDLNFNFVVHLVELYKRVGTAVLKEDPEANIWLEEGGGIGDILGGAIGTVNLYKPEELKNVIFTPHWYPDIYPFLGFNEPPRDFVVDEWMVRDFLPDIQGKINAAKETFGPVPVVFGEFGSYFNYNGIENSKKSDYQISGEILDNYYEAFEKLFASRILWCFSKDNTDDSGDLWNYENFSVIDSSGKERGERAYSRPYPRFLSGKPKELHFNSDYHYYDSKKGEPDPWREFHLSFESKETDMPTEIFVPPVQYADGFYVWISDGWVKYDQNKEILYYYPTKDDPGWVHEITIKPPQKGTEMEGWSYFFNGDQMIVKNRH